MFFGLLRRAMKKLLVHHPPESLALSKRQSGPTPAQRAPARCRRCPFDGLLPARSETLASRIDKLIGARRSFRGRNAPDRNIRVAIRRPTLKVLFQDKHHGAAPDGLTTLLHTTLRLAPLRAKTLTDSRILLLLNLTLLKPPSVAPGRARRSESRSSMCN